MASNLRLSKAVRVWGLFMKTLVLPSSVSYDSFVWSSIAAVADLWVPEKLGQVLGQISLYLKIKKFALLHCE